MSADDKPCQATLSVDLRQQIMDSRVPKNEREWWASRMIEKLERELAAEREKVRALHSALQNLADEQNGAPLERRREEWQEAMDEACAALAATEDKP